MKKEEKARKERRKSKIVAFLGTYYLAIWCEDNSKDNSKRRRKRRRRRGRRRRRKKRMKRRRRRRKRRRRRRRRKRRKRKRKRINTKKTNTLGKYRTGGIQPGNTNMGMPNR